jgi:hypothetical protein
MLAAAEAGERVAPVTNPTRRELLQLSAAAAIASTAGACATDPDIEPTLQLAKNPANRGNQVDVFSVHLALNPGPQPIAALKRAIKPGSAFMKGFPGIHYARIAARVDRPQLLLDVMFDRSRLTAMNFLAENAAALEPAFAQCEGYTPGTVFDPAALEAFLTGPSAVEKHGSRADDDKLFFTAYDTAQEEVAAALAVKGNFLTLLRSAERRPAAQLPYLVDRFLTANRIGVQPANAARPVSLPAGIPFAPQITNALTMVHRLKKGVVDRKDLLPGSASKLEKLEGFLGWLQMSYEEVFELILTEGEFAVRDLREHPLGALHTLHFARVAVVDEDDPKMMFASVYDGDFTQYVLDFGSRVADLIDALWGLTEGYPACGCRDVLGFIEWLQRGQIASEDFYRASGDVTLLRMQAAQRLRTQLEVWTRKLPSDPAGLRAELKSFTAAHQALLG